MNEWGKMIRFRTYPPHKNGYEQLIFTEKKILKRRSYADERRQTVRQVWLLLLKR